MQDIHSLSGGGTPAAARLFAAVQDIHSLSGGGTPAAARLFSAAAAGDQHLGLHHLHQTNQALKCPRCDSLNTKFCYYNNYNLSQPRHFCKSCRRYWTKGGVLRNVPVGGGCRKSRRSTSSSKSSSSKPPPSPSPSNAKRKPLDDSAMNTTANNNNNNNNNHSSSDSSTLTATAPTEIPTLFHEYGTTCLEKTTTVPDTETLYGAVDITLDLPIRSGVGRDDVSTSMLTEIGNFTGLMRSTDEIAPFCYAGVLTHHDHPQQQTHQQETVVVDGFGSLDWQGSGDENNGVDRVEELFDMTGAVDHAYWSQQNQWTAADVDVDHHQQQQGRGGLFLP